MVKSLRLDELARAHARLGEVLWSNGHHKEASIEFRQAEADWEAAQAAVKGASDAFRDRLASFLAECPDPECRNPAKAVQLAREAVKMDPRVGRYRRTLGMALFRAGDYSAALDALEDAETRMTNLGTAALFYKAMAYEKCEKKDQARQCFKLAEKRRGKNASLRLAKVRDEAAALLKQKKD
jgi:tetratricopeptide (TPR) repeat protein